MNLIERYSKKLHQAFLKEAPKTLEDLFCFMKKYGMNIEVVDHKEEFPPGTIDVMKTLGYGIGENNE